MKERLAWVYGIISVIFLYILYYFRNSDHFAGAIAFVLTVSFFHLADRVFEIKFKKRHYGILIFMVIFGLLLSPFYVLYPNYDKVLHLVNPFLSCFLIFYIVDKLKLDLKTKIIFTFTILITLITFAEIVEFSLDWLFDLKLQGVFIGDLRGTFKMAGGELTVIQSRITDTMIDLILGVCGSLVFVLGKFFKLIK